MLIENKNNLPSSTKFVEDHKFCAANISYHQRKTFWEIFATFNFAIVFLVVQVKSQKSKVTSILAAACNQVTLRVYRVFSRDAMPAMLVSPANPPGIELYYHANVFFCFCGKTRLLIT